MGKRIALRNLYTNWIDNDMFFDMGDITREELQQMEIDEFGEIGKAIKWDNWDKITKQTKEQLATHQYKARAKKRGKQAIPIYVYDSETKELLRVLPSALEAGEFASITAFMVLTYAKKKKAYGKYFFSFEPTNEIPNEKWVYVYKLDTKEYIGKYRTQVEASLALGLPKSKVGFVMTMQSGRFYSNNLYFTYTKL